MTSGRGAAMLRAGRHCLRSNDLNMDSRPDALVAGKLRLTRPPTDLTDMGLPWCLDSTLTTVANLEPLLVGAFAVRALTQLTLLGLTFVRVRVLCTVYCRFLGPGVQTVPLRLLSAAHEFTTILSTGQLRSSVHESAYSRIVVVFLVGIRLPVPVLRGSVGPLSRLLTPVKSMPFATDTPVTVLMVTVNGPVWARRHWVVRLMTSNFEVYVLLTMTGLLGTFNILVGTCVRLDGVPVALDVLPCDRTMLLTV